MESQNGDTLSIRGQYENENRNKSSSGRSKFRGISISLGKYVKMCGKCRKEGHYKEDIGSKNPKKEKIFDDAPSIEAKTTSDEGGGVYLSYS